MSVTVIIPTYNELENLPLMVKRLRELPIKDLRILIVDDNSPDGTGKLADDLSNLHKGQISVLHRSGKLGLGTAYISAFKQLLQTDVQYIVQIDADFSHEPEKIVEFLSFTDSYDLILGSRYIKGGNLDIHWAPWRKFLSNFGNFYARVILGVPVKDLTGGYRLWKREVLEAIPLDRVKSNGYVFQVEMAYLAHRLGYRIKEVPIYFAERQFGQSKMNLSIQVEAALRVWGLLTRYRDIHPMG